MRNLYFLLLFLPVVAISQNWKLFNPAYEVSFKDNLNTTDIFWDVENYFTIHTCKYIFDSETLQQDSTFLLYTDYSIFDISSIFEEYVREANGVQKLSINGEVLILPASYDVGQSWAGFESGQTFNVSCDSKTLQSVLGIMDSVYLFSAANGTSIKLSKKFGLVEWANTTTNISLFLSEKLNPKHKLHDYRNTCFFNKGFVYGGYDDTFHANGLGKYSKERIEILDKQTFSDHISYSIGIWSDYKTIAGCSNSSPQPCPWYYERDTIEVNVYEDQVTWDRFYGAARINHAAIKNDDTLFCFGGFPKFDTPCPKFIFSLKQGLMSDYYAAQLLDFRNFSVSCYYPATQPVSCSAEFDLMTTVENAEIAYKANAVYKSGVLKLTSGDTQQNSYTLVDVSGRILLAGAFNRQIEIPVLLPPGFYRVTMQSQDAEFSKNFVTIE